MWVGGGNGKDTARNVWFLGLTCLKSPGTWVRSLLRSHLREKRKENFPSLMQGPFYVTVTQLLPILQQLLSQRPPPWYFG